MLHTSISWQTQLTTFQHRFLLQPITIQQLIHARVVGGYVEVANNSTVSAGNEKIFAYDFPSDFKFAPIATATAVNIGNTPAGQNVTVILKNVTTSRVEGLVRFGASGDLSLAVHLIIIGIPN